MTAGERERRAFIASHAGGELLGCAAAALAICSSLPAFGQRGDDSASVRRKTETQGPAVSAGLGSQYVNLGVQAAYYLQLSSSRLRVAPYVAIGWATFGATKGVDSSISLRAPSRATGSSSTVVCGRVLHSD